jgi:Uma2 family endonuclease
MSTQTLMTLKQFEELPEDDAYLSELDEGELVKVSRPGIEHAELQANLIGVLRTFLRGKGLGVVLGETGFVLGRDPDTVRGPDGAFLSAERRAEVRKGGWSEGAPDIAVEIVPPNDRASDIARKTRQYLAAGACAVWIIYEDQIHVFEPGDKFRSLGPDDSLDAPRILPGFRTTLREILA